MDDVAAEMTARSVKRIISLTGLAGDLGQVPWPLPRPSTPGCPGPALSFPLKISACPCRLGCFPGLGSRDGRGFLRRGESLLVHCGAGIGRTGTLAACALICLGRDDAQHCTWSTRAGGTGDRRTERIGALGGGPPQPHGDPMTHDLLPPPHAGLWHSGCRRRGRAVALVPCGRAHGRARNYWIRLHPARW